MSSFRQWAWVVFLLATQCMAMPMSTWAQDGYRQTVIYQDGYLFMGNCDTTSSDWNFTSTLSAPPDIHTDSHISILYQSSTVLIYQATNGSIMMNQYTCDQGEPMDSRLYTDISDRAGIDTSDIIVPSSISAQISVNSSLISVYYQTEHDGSSVVDYIKGLFNDTTWQFQGSVSPVFDNYDQVVSGQWNGSEYTVAYTSGDRIFISQLENSDDNSEWYIDALPSDTTDYVMSNGTEIADYQSDYIDDLFNNTAGWTFDNWNASLGSLSLVMWESWSPLLFYIGNDSAIKCYTCNNVLTHNQDDIFDDEYAPYNPGNCGACSLSSNWAYASLTTPWLNTFYDDSKKQYVVVYISTDGNLLYLDTNEYLNNVWETTTYSIPATLSSTSSTTSSSTSAYGNTDTAHVDDTDTHTGLSNGSKVKIGVCVGVFVAGLSAVSILVWFRRRKHVRTHKTSDPDHDDEHMLLRETTDSTGISFLSKLRKSLASDSALPLKSFHDSGAQSPTPVSYMSSPSPGGQTFVAELPADGMEDFPQELPADSSLLTEIVDAPTPDPKTKR